MMKKKINYDKWSRAQLEKQVKTLKFSTGLLGGLLIVLLLTVVYISFKEKQINPLLITPLALSIIIPINLKRIKEIKAEIEKRD